MQKTIKKFLVNVFSKFLYQPEVQQILIKVYGDLGQSKPKLANCKNPYSSYSTAPQSSGEGVVFITGRFRSGSTLLWNVFRKSDEFTAYYEPFNERQWFNVKHRGDGVDKTHRGVDDYWLEYNELEALSNLYNEEWIRDKLYMSSSEYDPNMRSYIDVMIKHAKQRPVLQFNRLDFRLPWIKRQYPKAKLVHLYRNPRDQWCSFITDKRLMNKDDVQNTYVDAFYLDVWCEDLYKHFPFLNKEITPHPYSRFYYLWKLSYIFGQRYSDISLSYEEFVSDPKKSIEKLRKAILAGEDLVNIAEELISISSLGAWTKYADETWFEEKETKCEEIINQYFSTVLAK